MKPVEPTSKEFVRFVDVSKWQGHINWAAVRDAGARAAIIRVSDGIKHPDPFFSKNWYGARQNGLVRGVYQYVRPLIPARDQVRLLVDKLDEAGGLEREDLPPVCDIESKPQHMPNADVLRFVLDWCDLVEEHLGRRAIIYTYPYFWQGVTTRPNAYPLWIAHYGVKAPLVPSSWTRWRMWQTTGEGSMPGIKGSADLNIFDGSMHELRAFIESSRVEPSWRRAIKRTLGMNLRKMYTRT